MRLTLPSRLALPARFSRPSEETAAAQLAAAVALGLLFAVSLTLFGGPLAEKLKHLDRNPAASSTLTSGR